ncbi:MAG: RraA family protein [Bryobacteraceae bacterium]
MTPSRLLRLGAAALSDALGKTGAMDHDMKCVSSKPAMAGPAFTVRVHTADILMVAHALGQCPCGHVLVVDGQGERNTALWGDITTLCAFRKGLAGVVIDGAVRDVVGIRKIALPVFARAIVPNAGGAEYLGEIGVAVQCGGQVVTPGDWVVGDADGVVVIPASRLEAAFAKATAIIQAEKKIERAIRQGADLADLLKTQEIIERKSSVEFIPQLRGGNSSR